MTTAAASAGLVARLHRLHELVATRELSAVVCSAPETIAYLGGAYIATQTLVPDRLAFLVASRDGRTSLLVCNVEEGLVRARSPLEDIDHYVEFEQDPTAALIELLESGGSSSGRIGIQAAKSAIRSVAPAMPTTSCHRTKTTN